MRIEAPTAAEKYVEELYAPEDSGLAAVRSRLMQAGRWGVNIGAAEGRTLQVLLKLVGARRVVEIGTLFGYSTVWMARALSEGGRVWTFERDAECARQARLSFEECGVADRVTLIEGEALEGLRKFEGAADCIFIDANKSAYLEYLDWAVGALRPGGLLVADNVFMGGGVFAPQKPANLSQKQWSVMREFNDRVARSGEFEGVILPTREGLTVAVRTVSK